MRKRKVYLRKKEKRYIFETKVNGKTKHLVTLPTNYYKFLKEVSRLIRKQCPDCSDITKSSFFSKGKWLKIEQILASADYVNEEWEKPLKKVPTINIKRSSQKDAFDPDNIINEFIQKNDLNDGDNA